MCEQNAYPVTCNRFFFKHEQLKTSKSRSKPIQRSSNLKHNTTTNALEVQSTAFSSSAIVSDVVPEKLFYEAILGDDGQFRFRQVHPASHIYHSKLSSPKE